MIKKFFTLALALLISLPLAGCQLAQENLGDSGGGDRLIGVLITTQHLDLFDFEGYINDNINGFSGGDTTLDGDTAQYEGRLYAELQQQVLTSEETGAESTHFEYVFEKGISYFAASYEHEGESYVGSSSGEAISDGHMAVAYADGEETRSLEGTVYVVPQYMEEAFYINPVYQSADGRVYAVSGSGVSFSDGQGEGVQWTTDFEETTTAVTENGESMVYSMAVKIAVATMFPPQQVVVLQMDENSNVLSRSTYDPESVPQTLALEAGTEYIIVETHKAGGEGHASVTREVFTREDEFFSSFYCREDGICVKQFTQEAWG